MLNDVVATRGEIRRSAHNLRRRHHLQISGPIRRSRSTISLRGCGKQQRCDLDVGQRHVAFVAASVAKTGDMKITTPTATLGIRGTTALEVPVGAAANKSEQRPDKTLSRCRRQGRTDRGQ